MQGSICEKKNLQINPELDWKPVKADNMGQQWIIIYSSGCDDGVYNDDMIMISLMAKYTKQLSNWR